MRWNTPFRESRAALLEELNQPTFCPHGNPLPGYENEAAHWLPLTKIAVGEQVIIRRIHELAEEQRLACFFRRERTTAWQGNICSIGAAFQPNYYH
jgi:DtxR family Mn-dependent transcriptional regulator